MLILALRTDRPEAEVGLFEGSTKLVYETWQAHRLLAETLNKMIVDTLSAQQKNLSDLDGIVCYKGPGSFTGLRIGLSVVNGLAYGLEIPVVGKEGEEWLAVAIAELVGGGNDEVVLPEYGAPVHITQPKK